MTTNTETFHSIEIIDPISGKTKLLTPTEQDQLLDKGVFLGTVQSSEPQSDNQMSSK